MRQKIKILGCLSILILGFQNCARLPGLKYSDSSASSASTAPVQAPYALLTGEQILKGMLTVTNQPTASGSVMNEYNSRKSVFGLGPDLKLATSPMMVGITSLGGEVCATVLNAEKAQAAADRVFFGSIDFTKPATAVTVAQLDTAVRAMARNFWGRNETSEELGYLHTGKDDFLAGVDSGKVATSQDLMNFTCAGMLSAFDAMTY